MKTLALKHDKPEGKPIPLFRSAEYEARFMAAYDAVMQRWPAPYNDIFVPTRFGDTQVIANGPPDVQPILLLPPGGGHAPIWIRNVAALSVKYRTYAVDIVGELNKSLPTQPIRTASEFIAWMDDLLDGLHVDRAAVCGNSNGGFFALAAGLYLPKRIEKIILIDPAATFLSMPSFWLRFAVSNIVAPLIHSEALVPLLYDWLWQGFPIDTDYAELRRISKLVGNRYRSSINTYHATVFNDQDLRRIRQPVLLLIGDHEVIYKPEDAIRRAKRLVYDFNAKIVPNANHSAQYTAPDFVNAEILKFLSVDRRENSGS